MTGQLAEQPAMSQRDVEQWLLTSADSLAALGVKGVFGRSPDVGTGGRSVWVSFASELGSGRVVRRDDGECHTSALRHADGVVLINRSSAVTTSVELAAIVSALTTSAAAPSSTPRASV